MSLEYHLRGGSHENSRDRKFLLNQDVFKERLHGNLFLNAQEMGSLLGDSLKIAKPIRTGKLQGV